MPFARLPRRQGGGSRPGCGTVLLLGMCSSIPGSSTAGSGMLQPGSVPSGGASSGPDWVRPAGRAGWGHRTHRCRVSVMFWLIQGTQSATSRSLKRHFKLAGDPSSTAGSEPRVALGFVPLATAMLMVLSPSPARVSMPGWHRRSWAQAGIAAAEQDLGEMSLIQFQPAGFSPHYQHSGSEVSHRATTPWPPRACSSFPCPIPVGWLVSKSTKGMSAKPRRGQERSEHSLPRDRSIGKACLSIHLSVHPSVHLAGVKPSQCPTSPPAAWLPSRAGADTLIPVTYLSLQLSLNCFGSPSEGRLGREEGGDGKLKAINE